MNSHSFYRIPLSIGLSILYSLFFWEEQLGLNLFLFSSLLIGLLMFLNPDAQTSRSVWFTAAGSFISVLMVLLINSGTAKVVHLLSMGAFVGFVHLPHLRALPYAVASLLKGYLHFPRLLKQDIKHIQASHAPFALFLSYVKVSLIPILVFALFLALFYGANAPFASLINHLVEGVSNLFADLSLNRVLFFLSGFLLIGGMIFRHASIGLLNREQSKTDQLIRQRRKSIHQFSFIALKKEHKTAIILMGLINLLLLVNNVLDIQHVWLNFDPQSHGTLTQFVHEGTYFLIASILLSMGIMLYFFRGNLNFLKGNAILKALSYAWIAQNAILVFSVGMRNTHYIAQFALAYKRVGVFIFLLLTLFGLFTLYLKIRDRMSTFYLLKTNAWALYAVMIGMSMVNWDAAIARYNLYHYEQTQYIDKGFLLTLSDKTLPILMENSEVFPRQGALSRKCKHFQKEWESFSWLSWNLADARAKQYLED